MSALSTETNTQAHLPVPSFPDPNAQQNRVPGNKEMATLRRISEYNARAIRMFDEEIEQHQKTYNTLRNRYLKQQLELEVTQSELNRIQEFISASEAQRAVHELEQRDLLALMHPVRRCPDEVLREIFEYIICETTFGEKPLKQSFHLSSICQKWRAVAIRMPLLWTKVEFSLLKSPDALKHQQQTIISRIKGLAAKIHILTIGHHSGEQLEACGLKMFPFIGNLVLTLSNPEGTRTLLQSISPLQAGRVRNIRIQSQSTLNTPRNLDQPWFLGSNLLGQFPGLASAEIVLMPTAIFQLTNANATLTELVIANIERVSIVTILYYCPRLDTLRICNTTIEDFWTPIVATSLRYLELNTIQGDSWMAHTSLPTLDTLVLRINSTPASLAFIASNRSIKKLICRNALSEIVNIAPQLIELHVPPPLYALCISSVTSPSQVALPSLRDLFVNINPSKYKMTVGEFDTLVRVRCLPFGHPKSLARPSSLSLSSLTFVLPWTWSPQPQKWQQSQLYMDSTRSEITHLLYPGSHLRLTWPNL
ncbi:hypothetical protein M408DRAFT_264186 [Serendipita vermifera MAFF 305830]|uniref:F-box domain-containing protein n=1 Tax=Serendipita vermifera MAFF 305830 TaxID=933852 RepID=A0A0C2WA36_SERVB|nr:hypothetical protein M408DRAFT_264186 [Serendipita vermifera MAFF 305830]